MGNPRDDSKSWRKTRPYSEMWSVASGVPAKIMRREFRDLTRAIKGDQIVTFHFVVCRKGKEAEKERK